jgi:hypothetical protein
MASKLLLLRITRQMKRIKKRFKVHKRKYYKIRSRLIKYTNVFLFHQIILIWIIILVDQFWSTFILNKVEDLSIRENQFNELYRIRILDRLIPIMYMLFPLVLIYLSERRFIYQYLHFLFDYFDIYLIPLRPIILSWRRLSVIWFNSAFYGIMRNPGLDSMASADKVLPLPDRLIKLSRLKKRIKCKILRQSYDDAGCKYVVRWNVCYAITVSWICVTTKITMKVLALLFMNKIIIFGYTLTVYFKIFYILIFAGLLLYGIGCSLLGKQTNVPIIRITQNYQVGLYRENIKSGQINKKN